MTDVAVVGFAHAPHVRRTDGTTNGVEMLMPCFASIYAELGLKQTDIGFWCSGSSDYLAGRAFSFISAIDSIGAVPPINESHVEMDAAWALYEAYIKLLTGEIDTALVYGFGKSSAGTLRRVLSLQTDPYTVAPLWPDSVSMAGLQARAGLDAGTWTAEQMAQVAVDSFAASPRTDRVEAGRRGGATVDRLVVENRAASANLAETQAFMDDLKRGLIFSDAGGTGRSYADAPEIDGTVRLLPPEKASKTLKAGEFTRARIVATDGHDLVGQPI